MKMLNIGSMYVYKRILRIKGKRKYRITGVFKYSDDYIKFIKERDIFYGDI